MSARVGHDDFTCPSRPTSRAAGSRRARPASPPRRFTTLVNPCAFSTRAAAEERMPLSQQAMTTFSRYFFRVSPLPATSSCGTCRASITWPESNSALRAHVEQERALVQQSHRVQRAHGLAGVPRPAELVDQHRHGERSRAPDEERVAGRRIRGVCPWAGRVKRVADYSSPARLAGSDPAWKPDRGMFGQSTFTRVLDAPGAARDRGGRCSRSCCWRSSASSRRRCRSAQAASRRPRRRRKPSSARSIRGSRRSARPSTPTSKSATS